MPTDGWWQCSVGVATAVETGSTGIKPRGLLSCWQDVAAQGENLLVKVHHVGAHGPKSWAPEQQQSSRGVGQDAEAGVAQVDLHWLCEGELQLQGPVAPQAIKEEVLHRDVLMIQVWICTPSQWYCNKNDPGE